MPTTMPPPATASEVSEHVREGGGAPPAPELASTTPLIAGYSTRPISQWSTDDVVSWAKVNKLKLNMELLEEDDVDGPLLREISDGTLEEQYEVARPMQRKRIMQLINKEVAAESAVGSGGSSSSSTITSDAAPSTSRYQFIRLLGKGAFGAVELVHDTKQNVDVAKKIGHSGTLAEANENMAEAQTMIQIKHPNTVQFMNFFLDQDQYGEFRVNIIMEFCAGGDLQRRIKGQAAAPFSEPDVTHVLSSCLKGLDYIHHQQKVHRDIKPANILLAELGAIMDTTVKIGDFGLAKDFELNSKASRTRSMKSVSGTAGTEVFMAPEVYHDQKYKDTVDVWSLGITMIYMMSRKKPTAVADDADKVAQLLATVQGLGYSADLIEKCRMMLQVDVRRRPTATNLVHQDTDGVSLPPAERLATLLCPHLQPDPVRAASDESTDGCLLQLLDHLKHDAIGPRTRSLVQRRLKEATNEAVAIIATVSAAEVSSVSALFLEAMQASVSTLTAPAGSSSKELPLHERLQIVKQVMLHFAYIVLRFCTRPMLVNETTVLENLKKMVVEPAIQCMRDGIREMQDDVRNDHEYYRAQLVELSKYDKDIYSAEFSKRTTGSESNIHDFKSMCDSIAELDHQVKSSKPPPRKQPTGDMLELMCLCVDVVPHFQVVLKSVLHGVQGIKLVFRAETKALYRVGEKSLLKGPSSKSNGGDGVLLDDTPLDCSAVCDVVGCLVICQDFKCMKDVVDCFKEQAPKEEEAEVYQVKSRWTVGSDGGWRDLMCMLAITKSGSSTAPIICEVQVVLDTMFNARKGLKGHEAYAKFRSFFEMLNFEGLPTATDGADAARRTYRKRLTMYLKDGELNADEMEALKEEFGGGVNITEAEHNMMVTEILADQSVAGAARAPAAGVPNTLDQQSLAEERRLVQLERDQMAKQRVAESERQRAAAAAAEKQRTLQLARDRIAAAEQKATEKDAAAAKLASIEAAAVVAAANLAPLAKATDDAALEPPPPVAIQRASILEKYRKRMTMYYKNGGVVDVDEQEALQEEFGHATITTEEHDAILAEIKVQVGHDRLPPFAAANVVADGGEDGQRQREQAEAEAAAAAKKAKLAAIRAKIKENKERKAAEAATAAVEKAAFDEAERQRRLEVEAKADKVRRAKQKAAVVAAAAAKAEGGGVQAVAAAAAVSAAAAQAEAEAQAAADAAAEAEAVTAAAAAAQAKAEAQAAADAQVQAEVAAKAKADAAEAVTAAAAAAAAAVAAANTEALELAAADAKQKVAKQSALDKAEERQRYLEAKATEVAAMVEKNGAKKAKLAALRRKLKDLEERKAAEGADKVRRAKQKAAAAAAPHEQQEAEFESEGGYYQYALAVQVATCNYKSARGTCNITFDAAASGAGAVFCPRHCCKKPGCVAKKASADKFCSTHQSGDSGAAAAEAKIEQQKAALAREKAARAEAERQRRLEAEAKADKVKRAKQKAAAAAAAAGGGGGGGGSSGGTLVGVGVIPGGKFQGRKDLIGKMVLSSKVTSIADSDYGDGAFRAGAFERCTGLTSVVIGDSVTYVGKGAFERCTGLTSVVIGDSVYSIGNRAFFHCTGLTSVVIGDSVTSIGDQAFFGCAGLTSVVIPDSVTSVGGCAFTECAGLTSVVIPDSVHAIHDNAFSRCDRLKSVSISKKTKCDKRRDFRSFPDGCIITHRLSETEAAAAAAAAGAAEKAAFDEAERQRRLAAEAKADKVRRAKQKAAAAAAAAYGPTCMVDDVGVIPAGKYKGRKDLTGKLVLSSKVTSIAGGRNGYDGAFCECTELTSVVIGDSVTEVGGCAFARCTGLTSVVIGDSVTKVGDSAFAGCDRLKSVSISKKTKYDKSYRISFPKGCSITHRLSGAEVKAAAAAAAVAAASGGDSGGGPTCTVDDVGVIPAGKYKGRRDLTGKLVLSSKVTSIADGSHNRDGGAFQGCTGLTSVVIGDSVTSVGEDAFTYCAGLTSVVIGDSVTSVGNGAFRHCAGLTSVVIPDSVTFVGHLTFYGCDRLKSVSISKKTKHDCAFPRGCSITYHDEAKVAAAAAATLKASVDEAERQRRLAAEADKVRRAKQKAVAAAAAASGGGGGKGGNIGNFIKALPFF